MIHEAKAKKWASWGGYDFRANLTFVFQAKIWHSRGAQGPSEAGSAAYEPQKLDFDLSLCCKSTCVCALVSGIEGIKALEPQNIEKN